MNDEDAFMAALAARPGDDALLGVFADWLQEQGDDDRAGYLRLAVKLVPPPFGFRVPPDWNVFQSLRAQLPAEWVVRVEQYHTLNTRLDPDGHRAAVDLIDLLARAADTTLVDGLDFEEPFTWFQRATSRGAFGFATTLPHRDSLPPERRAELGQRMTAGWRPVLVVCHTTDRLRRFIWEERPNPQTGHAHFYGDYLARGWELIAVTDSVSFV